MIKHFDPADRDVFLQFMISNLQNEYQAYNDAADIENTDS